MLANAGGPAWQMHLLPQQLDKLTYIGTFTILFAVSNLLKIPAYRMLGQLTRENLAIGAVLLPVAVLANYAGIWLVRRTPTELFYRIAYVLMFMIAVELIRGSLSNCWRIDPLLRCRHAQNRVVQPAAPLYTAEPPTRI